MYYFAYGSNMNIEQMSHRCPDAAPIGPAVLLNYIVIERQYADIEQRPGAQVDGLLWEISELCLRSLDRYEGYPRFYIRYNVDVILNGCMLNTLVYEMTESAKRERSGLPYSADYRKKCSAGAVMHGIKDAFKL